MTRTLNALGVLAEKAEFRLRILLAFAMLLPAVMIGVAALGGEHGQFTLPQGTWFFGLMILVLAILIACSLLQFIMGSEGSRVWLGTLFLVLVFIPLWAMLNTKTVFETWPIIQCLMTLPIVGLIALVLWTGPVRFLAICGIPAAINMALGVTEAIGTALVRKVSKSFSTPLPRVPTIGQMTIWIFVAIGEVAALGSYLSYVTIGDEPKMVMLFTVATFLLFVLTLANRAVGWRIFLWFAIAIMSFVFVAGGHEKAGKKIEKLMESQWFNSNKQIEKKDSGDHRIFTRINRDYCEHDYADLDPAEDRFEVVLQSTCGLMMVEVPKTCREWHPQWSKTKPGQDPNQRWVGIKYSDTDIIAKRWPDNLERRVVPNRKMWLEGDDDDSIIIVCEVRQ